MSHYRKIDVRIWNDAKFNALTTTGKLGFFMLLTHPMMTALGAMRGTPGGLAEEIGMDPELFREGFRELLAQGMVEHDPKGPMIALPNFLKYNPPANPNAVKAWSKSLEFLPECGLKSLIIQRSRSIVERLGKPFLEPFVQSESREQRTENRDIQPRSHPRRSSVSKINTREERFDADGVLDDSGTYDNWEAEEVMS